MAHSKCNESGLDPRSPFVKSRTQRTWMRMLELTHGLSGFEYDHAVFVISYYGRTFRSPNYVHLARFLKGRNYNNHRNARDICSRLASADELILRCIDEARRDLFQR